MLKLLKTGKQVDCSKTLFISKMLKQALVIVLICFSSVFIYYKIEEDMVTVGVSDE